ncbi:TPR repeat protein-like protein [Venturia nashicola]|nr:TPR repeat protein-like protein [Venturia nashicola]
MSRIEELPDDFDEKLHLNEAPALAAAPDFIDQILAANPFPSKPHDKSSANGTGPALPPAMEGLRGHTVDEVYKMINRTPLFMTTLDETDGEGGENVELEAIKALMHEGTTAEIAGNFREQGNEQAKAKRWGDARSFYDQALTALRNPKRKFEAEEGETDLDAVEIDVEAEAQKERQLEEACYVNRALCSLELKNYRSCTLDCAAALRINPQNVKAFFRSSSACLAIDRIPEAEDACLHGLAIEPTNTALKIIKDKIQKRRVHLADMEAKRRERMERMAAEERILKEAMKMRGIPTKTTSRPPETEDAVMKLEDPGDVQSMLSIPTIFLYPAHLQSDFIKAFEENQTITDHLSYIFPLPWDQRHEYRSGNVECFMETITGGLIKAGKKIPLLKILTSGKTEVVDGMLRVYILPKDKVAPWVEEWKAKKGRNVT